METKSLEIMSKVDNPQLGVVLELVNATIHSGLLLLVDLNRSGEGFNKDLIEGYLDWNKIVHE